jgi:hypothetical protein
MNLRSSGRRRALGLSTLVGLVSLSVTALASSVLWEQSVQTKNSASAGSVSDDSGSQNAEESRPSHHRHDESPAGAATAPVAPSQGGPSQTRSSGS